MVFGDEGREKDDQYGCGVSGTSDRVYFWKILPLLDAKMSAMQWGFFCTGGFPKRLELGTVTIRKVLFGVRFLSTTTEIASCLSL